MALDGGDWLASRYSPLCHWEKNTQHALNWGLAGPPSRSVRCREETSLCNGFMMSSGFSENCFMPSFRFRAFYNGSNATALFLMWVPLTIDLGSGTVVTFLSRWRGSRIMTNRMMAPSVLRQRCKISKCRDICLQFASPLFKKHTSFHTCCIYFLFCFENSTQTITAWIRGTGRSGRRIT
jgi:hypothetical protein